MEKISVLMAFSAGLVSFLSPCILPLIPAYLSFISGVSVGEMRGEGTEGKGALAAVFLNALVFVLGFSAVFVSLGASATFIGQVFVSNQFILSKVGGGLVILFGVHVLGLVRLPFLEKEKRYHQKEKRFGFVGSFLIGVAFALGWTPCIGPILAGILFYASTKESVWQGVGLLTVYSAGLGIPFLLAALGLEKFLEVAGPVKRHFRTVEIVSGVLLIAMGVLMLTDSMTQITQFILKITGGSVPHT